MSVAPDTPPPTLWLMASDGLAREGLRGMMEPTLDGRLALTRAIPAREDAWETATRSARADLLLWLVEPRRDALTRLPSDAPATLLLTEESARTELEELRVGAQGILTRQASAAQIIAALLAIHQGLRVYSPGLEPQQAMMVRDPLLDELEDLSPREDEVLSWLAEGLSNRQIAGLLDISENTVKFHVRSILQKLEVASRTEAVVAATRMGLLRL